MQLKKTSLILTTLFYLIAPTGYSVAHAQVGSGQNSYDERSGNVDDMNNGSVSRQEQQARDNALRNNNVVSERRGASPAAVTIGLIVLLAVIGAIWSNRKKHHQMR